MWSREIGIKATLGAEAGVKAGVEHETGEGKKLVGGVEAVAKAGVEAEMGKVAVSFPDWIRNLLVEGRSVPQPPESPAENGTGPATYR